MGFKCSQEPDLTVTGFRHSWSWSAESGAGFVIGIRYKILSKEAAFISQW